MADEILWEAVARARAGADGPDEVAERVTALLAVRPPAEIIEAQRTLETMLADSYREDLWGAAYRINGGCSDDGFDYFRGWLLTQGRDAFHRVLADPDELAGLPAVREAAGTGNELECELMLGAALAAYRAATGAELPAEARIRGLYPDPGPAWDFEDDAEVARRLPRLAALYPA